MKLHTEKPKHGTEAIVKAGIGWRVATYINGIWVDNASGWKYDNIEGYITIDEFETLFKVNTTPNGFIVEVDSEKIIRSYDEDLNLIPD